MMQISEELDLILAPEIERWCMEYSGRRYLKNCPLEDVRNRVAYLLNNAIWPSSRAPIACLHPKNDSLQLYEKLHHCFHELDLRGEECGVVNLPGWPSYSRVYRRFPNGLPNPQKALVRYGSKKYMRYLYQGDVRVASARSYNDSTLSQAIRDDELQVEETSWSGNDFIKVQDDVTGEFQHVMKLDNFSMKRPIDSDFWVCCFTDFFHYRYFDDFSHKNGDGHLVSSDACVIIHDVPWFTEALMKAVSRQFDGMLGSLRRVRYYDTCDFEINRGNDIDVSIYKDISYAFEREFRYIWWPQVPAQKLEPFIIHVGSLEGRAELIELD